MFIERFQSAFRKLLIVFYKEINCFFFFFGGGDKSRYLCHLLTRAFRTPLPLSILAWRREKLLKARINKLTKIPKLFTIKKEQKHETSRRKETLLLQKRLVFIKLKNSNSEMLVNLSDSWVKILSIMKKLLVRKMRVSYLSFNWHRRKAFLKNAVKIVLLYFSCLFKQFFDLLWAIQSIHTTDCKISNNASVIKEKIRAKTEIKNRVWNLS